MSPNNVTSLDEPVKEDRFGEILTDIQNNVLADVEVLIMASIAPEVADKTHKMKDHLLPKMPQKNGMQRDNKEQSFVIRNERMLNHVMLKSIDQIAT
ncbi:hypothetical protein AMTR_s00144p00098980 [Amborella trichopoda]|uniref:Uncharacterized protein n=1 Tax=Amborella trichopoda TaxID=13333 RepID=W1P9P4_AMBTC|nr:hypothetical protein AMTR_s00144p00098980 [Amborella trichopoda]